MKTSEPKQDKNGIWTVKVIRDNGKPVVIVSRDYNTVVEFVKRLTSQKTR